MKKLLTLTILCGLFSCGSVAKPPDEGNLPDKKTMSVIKKAEKVVYYSLDPMSEDCSKMRIEGICTTGFQKELEHNEVDSLVSIIIENAKIPVKKGTGKFSVFIPVDVFQFIKGKDTVNFLVDLHCDMWMFSTGESKYDFDTFHASMEKLVYKIIGKTLPTDNVVANPIIESEPPKSIMPDSVRIVLQNTDSLMWYILDPMQRDDKEGFCGYYVLDKKIESDAALANNLAKLLLHEGMFLQTDMVKNCMFLPDLGFRVFSEKGFADIMFSFYCNECKIICNGKSIQSDCGIIKKDILKKAQKAFPKDRYLRILLNKTN